MCFLLLLFNILTGLTVYSLQMSYMAKCVFSHFSDLHSNVLHSIYFTIS